MNVALATDGFAPAGDGRDAHGAQVRAGSRVQITRQATNGDVELDEKVVEHVAGTAPAGQLLNELAQSEKQPEAQVAEEKTAKILVTGLAVDDPERPGVGAVHERPRRASDEGVLDGDEPVAPRTDAELRRPHLVVVEVRSHQ